MHIGCLGYIWGIWGTYEVPRGCSGCLWGAWGSAYRGCLWVLVRCLVLIWGGHMGYLGGYRVPAGFPGYLWGAWGYVWGVYGVLGGCI